MHELLARLLMLLAGDGAVAGIESVSWRFAGGGRTLLLVGLPLIVALAVFAYARTLTAVAVRVRCWLAVLRVLGACGLLLVVAGTVCVVTLRQPPKPAVLLLVDDSASMTLPYHGSTRLDLAETAAGNLRDELSPRFSVVTRHTSELWPAAARDLPQDLAASLLRAGSSNQAGAIDHLVLLSDGVENGAIDLADAAELLAVPVSTIAVGAADEHDAWLQAVHVPLFVYHLDQVSVTVDLRAAGLTGEHVTLRLLQRGDQGDLQVAAIETELGRDREPTAARLTFTANAAGLQQYLLQLDPLSGELTAANNTLPFLLDVRPERIRALFIEGQLGWEYKFARAALAADPAVTFHGLVRLPEDEWFVQGPALREDGKTPILRDPRQGVPTTLDELDYFNVVILGDVERKQFERGDAFGALAQFVRERGGGLATIGGMSVYGAGNYQDTALARLLPVVVEQERKKQLINRFHVQLTSQGLMHPVMQLAGDPVQTQQAWASLPWVEGGNALRRVKNGAALLLTHPTLTTAYGKRPVAAAWPVGRGRTFATALDGTWHWALAGEGEVDFHRRYWGLLVRWLAGDPRSFRGRRLVLDTLTPEAGALVHVSLFLKDDHGNPVADAAPSFMLSLPSSEQLQAPVTAAAEPGRYRFTFLPTVPGRHELRVALPGEPEASAALHLSIPVAPARAELLAVQARPDALARLATAADGNSGSIDALADWPRPVATQPAATQHRVIQVWQLPMLGLFIVLALALEWAWRKRKGLA